VETIPWAQLAIRQFPCNLDESAPDKDFECILATRLSRGYMCRRRNRRQRSRDFTRGKTAHLWTVLHHQGSWRRYGTRPGDSPANCEEALGKHSGYFQTRRHSFSSVAPVGWDSDL